MIRVKICGITSVGDALHAVRSGADALGFVFHEPSPRHVSPEMAETIIKELPPFIQVVGLFVNAESAYVNAIADRCGLDLVQLHGDEPPEYCEEIRRRVIKAFRVRDMSSINQISGYRVAGILLDAFSPAAYGGTGQTFNWDVAREAGKTCPIILAGGLTPENVRLAVEKADPYAVDVSSGVEAAPGRKDPDKVKEFICRAKLVP
ncbi:MAG TPA: phosphoribosylanthranilate isomerase [Geobacteraceae bacterium]|nr:phosphoribosylanthranilate isomerase [Geobacteraceae bacterium]